MGSPTFTPDRVTETTQNTDPDLPPAPQPIVNPIANPTGAGQPSVSGTPNAGPRNVRRSPPPDRSFILDPLL
jgi:hypothetical protein